MLRTLLVSGAAVSAVVLGSPAIAGPYANIENNASYQNGYLGSVTDMHLGYKGGDDTYGFYLQGGPAIVDNDGDVEVEVSGKIGGSVQATESFSVYGEVSFISDDSDPAVATKVGVNWDF